MASYVFSSPKYFLNPHPQKFEMLVHTKISDANAMAMQASV
jgi:hypothetical protein